MQPRDLTNLFEHISGSAQYRQQVGAACTLWVLLLGRGWLRSSRSTASRWALGAASERPPLVRRRSLVWPPELARRPPAPPGPPSLDRPAHHPTPPHLPSPPPPAPSPITVRGAGAAQGGGGGEGDLHFFAQEGHHAGWVLQGLAERPWAGRGWAGPGAVWLGASARLGACALVQQEGTRALPPPRPPTRRRPPPRPRHAAEKKQKKEQKEEAERHQRLAADLDAAKAAHFGWQVRARCAALACRCLHAGGRWVLGLDAAQAAHFSWQAGSDAGGAGCCGLPGSSVVRRPLAPWHASHAITLRPPCPQVCLPDQDPRAPRSPR